MVKGDKSLDPLEKWIFRLYEKKGVNKAAVALANKNARITWAIMAYDRDFDVNLASKNPEKLAA